VPATQVEQRSTPVERRRGPAPRTVLAIASVGAALAFLDATIVNIAFPDIVRSFPDASISSLSWVLNAYNIVFAAFLVAAGRLADLLGRRRVFVVGLQLFTFASLLCALAPSAGLLIAARVLQALGAGGAGRAVRMKLVWWWRRRRTAAGWGGGWAARGGGGFGRCENLQWVLS
jgi:NTE family protein